MRQFVIISVVVLLLTAVTTGCGGGSSTNGVTQIVVAPTGLSMNSGDVVGISAAPEDSSGNSVAGVTVTFNTSNSTLVNVSPQGLVCAGTWDAQFIDCNGDDAQGNPISGSATITASGGGVTSAAVPVTIHIKVTSVVVATPTAGTPATGACTSATQSLQFTAAACSTLATPFDTTGPCAPNAKQITSLVGQFSWGTIDPAVASVDNTGLVTAVGPGLTGVFASASSASSSPIAFKTCLPIEIRLHVQDSATSSEIGTTQNSTFTLETDMVDENKFTENSISTVVASNAPIVGSLSGLTLAATSFGGAGISAGCTPPNCGTNLNIPIYANLFPITVTNGSSPNPTVYATSSFTPPAGTAPTLLPITTNGTSAATVGTAVPLPGVPNSMVFAANGTIAYLGTNAGLVSFIPGAATVSIVDDSILGKVLAVAPDGSLVIVSNAATDPQGNVIEAIGPSQRLWIFEPSPGNGVPSTQQFVKPAATAAAINGDGFRTYVTTNDGTGNVYVFSPQLSLQTVNLPTGAAASGVATLPSGPFVFIADNDGLDTLATCNNVKQTLTPSTNGTSLVPTSPVPLSNFVQQIPSQDAFVVVDSPGIDVETATVTSIFSHSAPGPVNITAANCQPFPAYSNQFINFGAGPYTPHQLLVATNGSEIAVLPVGSANILTAVPGASPSVKVIPLAAGTEAFTGGMTPDGSQIWVGVGGSNTVDGIIGGVDAVQVPASSLKFTKADGTAAPPDIVAVEPK